MGQKESAAGRTVGGGTQRILVCLGCHKKYQRQGDLSNRHLVLLVLEAGKAKVKVLADLLPGESLSVWFLVRVCFLACRQLPSCCVLTWQRERSGGSPLSFYLAFIWAAVALRCCSGFL